MLIPSKQKFARLREKRSYWAHTILGNQFFQFTIFMRTPFQVSAFKFFSSHFGSSIVLSNKGGSDTDKRKDCDSWYLIECSNRHTHSCKLNWTCNWWAKMERMATILFSGYSWVSFQWKISIRRQNYFMNHKKYSINHTPSIVVPKRMWATGVSSIVLMRRSIIVPKRMWTERVSRI